MANKRFYGEGSLQQKENGTFSFQVSVINVHGESERKTFTGKSKKIVKEKHATYMQELEAIKKKIAMGLSIPDDLGNQNISLSKWVFDWIGLYKKPPIVKASTYASYMFMWEMHVDPFFGTTPLAAIANKDVQLFYRYLLTEGRIDGKEGGLSPKSVQNIHNFLHSALKKAVGVYILRNPTDDTDRPPVHTPEMRVLSTEEMDIFVKEIFIERLRAAIFVSLFTGIRMGELLALTWNDLDMKKQTISINKNLIRITLYDEVGQKDGTKLIVQNSPKSEKSNRIIPLQEDIFKMLVFHRQLQITSLGPNPLNLVFPSKVGSHTDPRTYQKRVAAVSKRCEIQRVNVHALRHTFATRLVEQKIPMRVIQELLGHAAITTTMRYTHALEEEKTKAVESMGSFLERENTVIVNNL